MLRILHPSLATMNHSCIANTRIFQREDDSVCIRAQTPILKGQEIFNKYTPVLAGRLERTELVREIWNFQCECPRCMDASDLGSDFDTIKCAKCRGDMLPETGTSSSSWTCKKCENNVSRDKAKELEEHLADKMKHAAGDIKHLEALLQDNQFCFHSNHHSMLAVKVI